MKRIFLALFLCIATALTSGAQAQTTANKAAIAVPARQKMPAGERAKPYTDQLKKELGLNDAQYQKVLAVNTECINRKDAGRASGKSDAQSISAYRKAQYQQILTPEQMATLNAKNSHAK